MNKKKLTFNWAATKQISQDKGEKKKFQFKDERFYYPKRRDDGTAEAVIRLLPPKIVGDTQLYDLPYVEFHKHGFQDMGGWFIQDCPKTIGLKCPVCEDVDVLYKRGDRDAGRARCKKVEYIVNIMVIKDPQTPENNGKVFLYRMGKKIKEKVWEKWFPNADGIDDPIDIWDYYDGANFKLKIKKTGRDDSGRSHPDYSTSEFMSPSELPEDLIEKANNEMVDLREFVDPTKFKSYTDLLEKYKKVIGVSSIDSGYESPKTEQSVIRIEKEEDLSVETDESSESLDTQVQEEDDFFSRLRDDSKDD
jgi:hypothetical protein